MPARSMTDGGSRRACSINRSRRRATKRSKTRADRTIPTPLRTAWTTVAATIAAAITTRYDVERPSCTASTTRPRAIGMTRPPAAAPIITNAISAAANHCPRDDPSELAEHLPTGGGR